MMMAALACTLLFLQQQKWLPEALPQALHHYVYAPLREAVYAPLRTVQALYQQQQADDALQEQLALAQQQNRELRAQLQVLAHYRAENHRLRRLMESVPTVTEALLIAELRDTAMDGYSEHITINKGQNQGVRLNQAVIDPYGLVGQVVQLYPNEAQVMLISDARSRVPVYVERTQQRAIVAGHGGYGGLQLSDLRLDSDIQVGDRLISSGLGSVFPRGYPVAQVTAVQRDQRASFLNIQLQAVAQLNSMLEVLLLAPSTQQENIPIGPSR